MSEDNFVDYITENIIVEDNYANNEIIKGIIKYEENEKNYLKSNIQHYKDEIKQINDRYYQRLVWLVIDGYNDSDLDSDIRYVKKDRDSAIRDVIKRIKAHKSNLLKVGEIKKMLPKAFQMTSFKPQDSNC